MSSSLQGATVALVTPFGPDGAVDETALRHLVDWQIEEGIGAILATGTTGEAATLDEDEQKFVIATIIDQAAGRCPVVAGTGTNSTEKSRKLTLWAEEAGADAGLLVGPYYNKPTQRGYARHFSAIAEAVEFPLILYNVPGRTGSNIEADTVLELAKSHANIVGVKEASGRLDQIMHLIAGAPDGFLVLAGDDAITLPLLALGGHGVISVVSNQVPGEFSAMVSAALAGEWEEARRLHYRLLPLMEMNFIESNPIPVKASLAMMGRMEEVYRLPLVEMAPANRERLRALLVEMGLL